MPSARRIHVAAGTVRNAQGLNGVEPVWLWDRASAQLFMG